MALVVELAPGLHRIPTAPLDLVNSFVIRDDDGRLTLIDAGAPGARTRILAGLAELGYDPNDVTTILATHGHSDHVGSLRSVRDRTGARVLVHAGDAAGVEAGVGPPLDPSRWLGRIRRRNLGSAPCPVDGGLVDGEVLDIGGGLEVVHTPGHSPGHVSLLHRPSRTLVTGDAIWNMNGRRTWPVLAFCTDVALLEQTVHRLTELDYLTAAFTHGPEIFGSGREAVRAFVARPRPFRMFL